MNKRNCSKIIRSEIYKPDVLVEWYRISVTFTYSNYIPVIVFYLMCEKKNEKCVNMAQISFCKYQIIIYLSKKVSLWIFPPKLMINTCNNSLNKKLNK